MFALPWGSGSGRAGPQTLTHIVHCILPQTPGKSPRIEVTSTRFIHPDPNVLYPAPLLRK